MIIEQRSKINAGKMVKFQNLGFNEFIVLIGSNEYKFSKRSKALDFYNKGVDKDGEQKTVEEENTKESTGSKKRSSRGRKKATEVRSGESAGAESGQSEQIDQERESQS